MVELKNFRSYRDYSLELSQNVNIIVGPNASGKTNLLEALYVLSRGKSFRAVDRDLIMFGKDWFRLSGKLDEAERTLKFTADVGGTSKELDINGTIHKRLSQKQLIPTTLFDPDHMRLLNGSPDGRRQFLDSLLEQLDDAYGTNLRKYKRALAQRNKLLKSSPQQRDHIFGWDVKLAEHGAHIHNARLELIEDLNKSSSAVYSELANIKSTAKFEYISSVTATDYQSRLLKELHERQSADLERGFTTVGPHRDDFSLILNNHPAQTSASRGETRTAVLMAKIVELKLLEEHTGQRPLLLLDDVFSELDGSRRRALAEFLKPYQTIITTTDADAIVKKYLKDYSVIPLTG